MNAPAYNPGMYTDTAWKFAVTIVDAETGEPVDIDQMSIEVKVYDPAHDNAEVFRFFGAGSATTGSVEMDSAAAGIFMLEATASQHEAVEVGHYLWEARDVADVADPHYVANGTLYVGEPGGRQTEFKVLYSYEGTIGSAALPGVVITVAGDVLVRDNYAAVRDVLSPLARTTYARSKATLGDNGETTFMWSPASLEEDDGWYVLKPNDLEPEDPGRYVREDTGYLPGHFNVLTHRPVRKRLDDVISLENFYAQGAIRGTETADTDAFKAAISYFEKINGGTILVPALNVPRLIGEPLILSSYRLDPEDGSTPLPPSMPPSSDPDVRKAGSLRIVGPGTGVSGSINEIVDGLLYTPGTLRYVGDMASDGGLFDIVSAYNIHISGFMLDNGSANAEFITRVRAYEDPATSCSFIFFTDCLYNIRSFVTSDAQHIQQDCKHVVHRACRWMYGEDGSGNRIPCIRLGENNGVNPTQLDGDSVLAEFHDCGIHGSVVLRRAQNATFNNCEFYRHRRNVGGSTTLGAGGYIMDGDKRSVEMTLDQVNSTDGTETEGTAIFFDATGGSVSGLKFKSGQIRNKLRAFVLDGGGPWHIGGFFNNPDSLAIDVEILATAQGQYFDTSRPSLDSRGNTRKVRDLRLTADADSARHSLVPWMNAIGHRRQLLHEGSSSIPDNTAVAFYPTGDGFNGMVILFVGVSINRSAVVWCRGSSSGSSFTQIMAQAGSLWNAIDNTILEGTTGPDGFINVSSTYVEKDPPDVGVTENAGRVYVENRVGGTISLFAYMFA